MELIYTSTYSAIFFKITSPDFVIMRKIFTTNRHFDSKQTLESCQLYRVNVKIQMQLGADSDVNSILFWNMEP